MKPKRPFGVTVIALLLTIYGLAILGSFALVTRTNTLHELVRTDYEFAGLLLDVFGLVIAFGLWRLRRWAWLALMLSLGVTMALYLGAYLAGQPPYISMLIKVVMVFYLNQSEVRQAFGHHGRILPAMEAAHE
ncbi:MAG: hypothetical protein H6671_17700 [Anaerolineaceae bacterium]|nr:hypothetical protein [Anaerolineaceae bacterium]